MVYGLARTSAFGETPELVQTFVEQTNVTFPVGFSPDTLFPLVAWPPAISPYPRQLVIDRDGVVTYVASEHRQDELTAAIEAALAR